MADLARALEWQATEQERTSAAGGAEWSPVSMPAHGVVPSSTSSDGGSIEHLHQGEGSPWTVQGLGYDEADDRWLTAYYHDERSDDDPGVRLSVQDRSGDELNDVFLAGVDGGWDPTKGGGVAVDGDYVYVADTDQVYVYRRDDIYGAADGDVIDAVRVNEVEAGSASYINIENGRAYVGRHVKNLPFGPADDGDPEVNIYDIDPETGRFVNEDGGHWYNVDDPRDTHAGPRATIETPYNVQGIAVTDDGILYSASRGGGFGAVSDLIWEDWSDRDGYELSGDRHEHDIVDYGQGVQIIDDTAYVSFEGGADQYDPDDGINEIRTFDVDDIRD